jgi:hypothetical protein
MYSQVPKHAQEETRLAIHFRQSTVAGKKDNTVKKPARQGAHMVLVE